MSDQVMPEQLIVLVVDDQEQTRKVRRDQLERRGWQVILADSRSGALRELKNSPLLDAVLTDTNLIGDREPNDTSGIDLARDVRSQYGEIPIWGYSAYDRPLSTEERELFSHRIPKGFMRSGKLQQQLDVLEHAAREYRDQRAERARSARRELRSRVRLETIEPAETVRRLMPEGQRAAGVEQALREAGFRLQLVHSASFTPQANPLLVWTRQRQDVAEAEVYGQPALYADGATERDAVEHLVELMRLFTEDFQGAGKPPTAGQAELLRAFLERTVAPVGDS